MSKLALVTQNVSTLSQTITVDFNESVMAYGEYVCICSIISGGRTGRWSHTSHLDNTVTKHASDIVNPTGFRIW